MNIIKARSIFNITSASQLNEEELKKTKRHLMKLYHPDNNSGDAEKASEVNEAYRLLVSCIGNDIDFSSNETTVITLSEIVSLYKTKQFDRIRELSRNAVNVHVAIYTNVRYNGDNYEINSLQLYNKFDRYKVDIKLYTDNMDTENIEIETNGKKLSTTISTMLKVVTVDIDNTATVEYRITRVINGETEQ